LDQVLILGKNSGITLFEQRGQHVLFDKTHAEIFGGFLSAIQCVTQELNIGDVTQISTTTHHCIMYHNNAILVILILDISEKVSRWARKAKQISDAFSQQFGNPPRNANNTGQFAQFGTVLEDYVSIPKE
jgi:hypothetical protein